MADMRTLLEQLELVEQVNVQTRTQYILNGLFRDERIDIGAAYEDTGVLTFEHVFSHGRLNTLHIADGTIAMFKARPGRLASAESVLHQNKAFIRCWLNIDAPEYHFRREWSEFLEEHINHSLARFCEDVADMYRILTYDPTLFRGKGEVGHA